MVGIQLPDGATLDRTQEVVRKAEQLISSTEGVKDCLSIIGYSIIDGGASANTAFCVVTFEPWGERGEGTQQADILAKMQRKLGSIQEAGAFPFPMPSLPGVGVSGGFTYMLQDKEGSGLEQLQVVANEVIGTAAQDPSLAGVRTTFRSSTPQLYVDIDREQVKRNGTSLSDSI